MSSALASPAAATSQLGVTVTQIGLATVSSVVVSTVRAACCGGIFLNPMQTVTRTVTAVT